MTTYAINRSEATLPVDIEFPEEPSRSKETVFIQPKSKAVIPPKSRVPAGFLSLNAKDLTLKTVDSLGEPTIPE